MTEREKLLIHMDKLKRKKALNAVYGSYPFTWGPDVFRGIKPGELDLLVAYQAVGKTLFNNKDKK